MAQLPGDMVTGRGALGLQQSAASKPAESSLHGEHVSGVMPDLLPTQPSIKPTGVAGGRPLSNEVSTETSRESEVCADGLILALLFIRISLSLNVFSDIRNILNCQIQVFL